MKRVLLAAAAALVLAAAAGCTPANDVSGVGAEIARQEQERTAKLAAAEKAVRDCIALGQSGKGLTTTASGLRWAATKPGNKALAPPTAQDEVRVHYIGALMDGMVFDSSFSRGEPAQFLLGQVVPGWTEGLQLAPPGGALCLIIPPQLGYGEAGAGGDIPPNATLAFHVELLGFTQPDGTPIGKFD